MLTVNQLKEKLLSEQRTWIFHPEDESSAEVVHFLFVGNYQGKEVVFDSFISTLEAEYNFLLYEQVNKEMKSMFPHLSHLFDDTQPNEGEFPLEVFEAMGDVIADLETDDDFKVGEYVKVELENDGVVSLDAALYVEEINEDVITRFVQNYTSNQLQLDSARYSFSFEEDEE